jgi:hypothetical protein
MSADYLTTYRLCTDYPITARTAERWRTTGDGPPFVRLGPRKVVYRRTDVEAWLAGRTYQHRAAELIDKESSLENIGRKHAHRITAANRGPDAPR